MQTQIAKELQLPIFHLNGNNPKALGQQYFNALMALDEFQDKFFAIEFHARDYYPLGDEAWLKAKTQWETQKANMASLRDFLDVHTSHCFQAR